MPDVVSYKICTECRKHFPDVGERGRTRCFACETKEKPMPVKRIAWMAVSRSLFEELCGWNMVEAWQMSDLVEAISLKSWNNLYSWREGTYRKIRDALLLPANATVVGVSLAFRFAYNEVAIQIECPDFVETPEGCMMPQTEAVYGMSFAKPYFIGWSNMGGGKMKEPPERPPLVWLEEPATEQDVARVTAKLAARFADGSLGKAVVLPPGALKHGQCWRCKQLAPGKVVGDVWECEECGRKPLL